ncbi:virulence-associated E family protein, partial [Lyngbya sp. CCY1209]|uniref:virulence-associated E family protein n=1 Tax=Lyngbya sp. CCY1209 TaxID=2886103 RepID=UPI002D20837F
STWTSAQRRNPTPCLSDDKIENCIKAYRRQPLNAIGPSFRQETSAPVEKETLQILKDLENIKRAFGGRIQYNTRFKQVEIDGEPLNPDAPEIDLAKKGNIQIKGSLRVKHQIILDVAKENSFDPFLNYLEDCHRKRDGVSRIAGAAQRYFGTENPLHQRYLECVLVGTVARAYKPGCKFDTLFILHGEQGLGKSTWFRKMVSDNLFCDDMGDFKDKDERLKMHQSVWTEWAEVENNINRSTSGKIKAFITTQTDNIRPPYAQRSTPYPRMSVLVGSTNRTDFNHDETGARRFMVIPVSQPIPVDLVDEERDQVWGEAVDLYKQGYRFHLTREEQQQANLLNEEFTDRGYLHDLIEEFVADRDEVWTEEIKEWLDTKEDEKYKIGEFSRLERDIKKVMTGIGFRHGRWKRNSIKRSGYRRIHSIQQGDRQDRQGQAENRQGVPPETPAQQDFQTQGTGRTGRQAVFETNDRATPDLISCNSRNEYVKAFQEIFKDLAGQGKYRIGRKKLLLKFKKWGEAEAVLTELIDIWRLQEINGYIHPVPPTQRREWFSVGKEVVITKDGDKLKGITGKITEIVNERTVRITAERQSFQYLVKDLKPGDI